MNSVFIDFLIILHSQVTIAQFTDDFSDGYFTAIPGGGNVEQFKEIVVLSR